jgi:hypothetical protein
VESGGSYYSSYYGSYSAGDCSTMGAVASWPSDGDDEIAAH